MISTILALLMSYAVTSTPDEFVEVNDLPAPSTAPIDEEIRYQQLAAIAQARTEDDETVQEVESWDGWYWEPTYYEPSDYVPSEGLSTFTGVNYHDGRMETFYSSNVLYHYRTPEWTLDDEGFWRTEEGYYVVAASDMEQGATFEGSKGTCIVLDTGCNEGVTDYYVAW